MTSIVYQSQEVVFINLLHSDLPLNYTKSVGKTVCDSNTSIFSFQRIIEVMLAMSEIPKNRAAVPLTLHHYIQ